MAERAKYKVDQKVEFNFVGSKHVGIIELKENINNKVIYKIRTKKGMLYPVQQDKVIGKVE